MLEWAVESFVCHPEVHVVVVVAAAEELEAVRALCTRVGGVHAVVPGGSTRAHSVLAGLRALPDDVGIVLVHDAARPAVTPELISRIIQAVERHGAAVPGLPVADTLKRVDDRGVVVATVDRSRLWAVQTPQGARREWLARAYEETSKRLSTATDEASLLEAAGLTVMVIPGDQDNIKVTAPEDARRAEEILARRLEGNTVEREEVVRTGFGYDVHRTAPGKRLRLGGVNIEHPVGLAGHSDADVVLHAVCDAILGALGIGDIGTLFPDTDPGNKDRNSTDFVAEAAAQARARGWQVQWLDITLVADEPRIGPYRQAMRETIGAAAGLPWDRVSVKATTNEGLGFAGRREGMACWAVATLGRTPAESSR